MIFLSIFYDLFQDDSKQQQIKVVIDTKDKNNKAKALMTRMNFIISDGDWCGDACGLVKKDMNI